ncbi:MAG: putative ABC exporter domain-containing protein, partial [Gemmatimonadaceae bacterium]
AFLYLVSRSARNRLASLARGTRSPRYIAALAVGVLYIWTFLVRPVNRGAAAPMLLGQPTEMIVTLLSVLTLMGSWIFGSDSTALAFTPAELSLLFPAPISRRALMGYKLFRAQTSVLINSVIWVFVLRRGGTGVPGPFRAIAVWTLFSTLNLHRLGAALVRTSWREHARAGVRRHGVSTAVFVLVGAAVISGVARHWHELVAALGAGAFFTALGSALANPPASWGLFPFHVVVAPAFAHTTGEWARAIVPAFGVLAFHVWWVLRTDSAFEDAAIEASAERMKRLAAIKARRGVGAAVASKTAKSTIALSSVGHPAIGIFWKNILCLRRTAQLRLLIGPTAMAIIIGGAIGGEGKGPFGVIAAATLVFAGLLVVFGGRLIRNDLRQDMQHLPLLKTLPIAPGDLMVAEVASAALPMAALQFALLLVSCAASFGVESVPLSYETRLAVLAGAPFAVLALNGALLTIQNGTAVLFPAWIRLGPAVNTGVEALGQNLLASVANLVSLAIALVIPAIIAVTAVTAIGPPRAATLTLLIIVASGALAAETYFALRLLGRAFARAEPLSGI